MSHLLQLSGVIVDLVYQVQEVPQPGDEAIVSGFHMSAGGGFNAMVAACRSGMHTTYGGGLGQGPLAELVKLQLEKENIKVVQKEQKEHDQGCCTVLIDSSGERTFIAKEGAEGAVNHEQLSAIDSDEYNWILISGYALVYEGSRIAVADWIEKLPSSCCVVFDPCPLVSSIPETILKKVMDRSDWISCNATEARYLTGLGDEAGDLTGLDDVESAAWKLAASLPLSGGAVVRHGESGCTIVHERGSPSTIPGFLVRSVDTNGAGDSHVGTFIASLARGIDPRTACRIANAAAALSTTFEGPASTPHLNDVEAFLARFTDCDDVESSPTH